MISSNSICKYLDNELRTKEVFKNTSKEYNAKEKINNLKTTILLNQNRLEQEVAFDPEKRKNWDKIYLGIKWLDSEANQELETLIKMIVNRGLKIREGCTKYELSLEEWGTFFREFNQPDLSSSPPYSTPIEKAIMIGDIRILKLLIFIGIDINKPNQSKLSPLAFAIKKGRTKLVEQLIELRVSLDQVDGNTKCTPLALAIVSKQYDIVELLLKKGGLNVNGLDQNQMTPLTMAVRMGDPKMLQLLVDLGAEIELSDLKGRTPLTTAVRAGHEEIVKLLIVNFGANVNLADKNGMSPLLTAVDLSKPSMVKLLVSFKAGINLSSSIDAGGKTPLTWAVRDKNFSMVKLLAELGADLNAFDLTGLNPLMQNFFQNTLINRKEMNSLLIKLGANEDITTEPLQRKLLAQIWGIAGKTSFEDTEGRTVHLDLERYSSLESLTTLSNYAKLFFQSTQYKELGIAETITDSIQEAIQSSFPLASMNKEETTSRIDSGKPCVVLGGFEAHAVSFVFMKNILLFGDRGLQHSSDHLHAYAIPKLTSEIIEKFQKKYQTRKEFDIMFKQLNLKYLGSGGGHKSQKINNCTIASSKLAFYSLFTGYIDEKLAKKVYKMFTLFLRTQALRDYLAKSPSPDIHLLREILSKIKKKKKSIFLFDEVLEKRLNKIIESRTMKKSIKKKGRVFHPYKKKGEDSDKSIIPA